MEVEAVKTANGIVGIWGDNVCLNNNKCNTEICPIILEEAQKEQKRQKEIIMNQMEREKKWIKFRTLEIEFV